MLKAFTLLLISGLSLFAASCTTEQGAYSGGYSNGTQARLNPHENKNMDYYILKNGGCNGMAQAYSTAKYIAPTKFKPSVETVYSLCVQGAFTGYDGKKPGKYYKRECEDYPIAQLSVNKPIKHISKNRVSNFEDEQYSSEENQINTKQKLLSQKELEEEEKKQRLEIEKKVMEEAKAAAEQKIAQAKIDEEKRIADEKARLEAEAEYNAKLPEIKASVLTLRRNTTSLMCNEDKKTFGLVPKQGDLNYCLSNIICTRIIDIKEVPYVFVFKLEKELFGGYKAKLYKDAAFPLSRCRSQEENDINWDLHFGQYKHLPLKEMNEEVHKNMNTKDYKTIESNWNLMYPVWGYNTLDQNDIRYAMQQIENEMNNEK